MLQKFFLVCFFGFLVLCGCNEKQQQEEVWQNKKAKDKKTILFLGDSLTAGYGLAQANAFPSLLNTKWEQENILYQAKNAARSGATSYDTLENIDWVLTDDVTKVFLCIGANDGLQGKEIEKTKENIVKIISICQQKNIDVILAGMMIPTNYGEKYRQSFYDMYLDIAKEFELKFMAFLLKDVAGNPNLNLADGIHPNKEGHKIIASNVHEFLVRENLLR